MTGLRDGGGGLEDRVFDFFLLIMMAASRRGGRWVELSAALCVGTELPQGPDLSAVAAFFARSELYVFSLNVCTQPSVKGRLCGSLPHGTLPYVRGRVLFTLRAHVQQ